MSKEFGERLNKLLAAKRINALTLSKEIGIPKTLIYEWKRGTMEPGVAYIFRLAEYFGVSVNYLRGLPDDDLPEQELLVMLRDARRVSDADYRKLVEGFKQSVGSYLAAKKGQDEEQK